MSLVRLIDAHSGHLSEHAIDHCPPYLAISHAWSEQLFPSGSLYVDSPGRAAILRVIEKSLLAVTYCWIDTLCIMQDDDDDKHRQIPLMGKIFGNAVAVVIILNCDLGLRQDMVDKGVARLSGAVTMHETESWQEKGLYWSTTGRGLVCAGMKALAQLTKTAWATRVWTLQEYILAREVIWIGLHDLQPVVVPDVLFPALTDVCDTLAITECMGGEWDRLYSFFSGMASNRLGRVDRTRVMELLGNRQASVEADEVYGVMAASGVEIQGKKGEKKEKAWENWVYQALRDGHVRWLLMPEAIRSARSCIVPAFEVRHKMSAGSALDSVTPLGPVKVANGTACVTGRWIGGCKLLARLGQVYEPTPNRIHRDLTLIVFSRGNWQRANQIARAFGAGRYHDRQLAMISRVLIDNYGRAMMAARRGRSDGFKPIFRGYRQKFVWSDFMQLQMGEMPGMNEGIAYLAQIKRGDIAVDVIAVLGQYIPTNPLEVIDIGGRTVDERCVFMIVERQEVEHSKGSSALHKAAVTLPVRNDFAINWEQQIPLQKFCIGGSQCWKCGSGNSIRKHMVPESLEDQISQFDIGEMAKRAVLDRECTRICIRRSRSRTWFDRHRGRATWLDRKRMAQKDAKLRNELALINQVQRCLPCTTMKNPGVKDVAQFRKRANETQNSRKRKSPYGEAPG